LIFGILNEANKAISWSEFERIPMAISNLSLPFGMFFNMTKVAQVKKVADAKQRGAVPNGFQFQSQHEIAYVIE
jgi:hypothetical protein